MKEGGDEGFNIQDVIEDRMRKEFHLISYHWLIVIKINAFKCCQIEGHLELMKHYHAFSIRLIEQLKLFNHQLRRKIEIVFDCNF